jgi:YVTN family beta-propeller protein
MVRFVRREPLSLLAIAGIAALITLGTGQPAMALPHHAPPTLPRPLPQTARGVHILGRAALSQFERNALAPGARLRYGFGTALVGTAPVGHGPSLLAVDPATHTIYAANGNNNNGPSAGGDTVSVIDSRRCDARNVSRCKGPWPTIVVGNRTVRDLPSGIAIDQRTDTVYVTNVGDDTVSVVNGATCNAIDARGCRQRPREVRVGLGPLEAFADSANHTVYITNLGNGAGNSTTVSMINSARCNATHLGECPTRRAPTVNVKAVPMAIDVDEATHSAYVTTLGQGPQNGWAVFDTRTCNATLQSGCHRIGKLTGDLAGPNDGQVDPANDTLYTANYDNTISVYNLHRCSASDLGGCAGDKPGIVSFPVSGFDHDLYVAVDVPLDSVYVTFQNDDALVIIDTRVCNGGHLRRCATLHPPTIHTGADPEGVVLDARTQTVYTANEVAGDVSVINARRCNVLTTVGCRHPAPDVAVSGPSLPVVDQAVHTVYVPSGTNDLTMIDTSHCSAGHHQGCSRGPRRAIVGQFPQAAAVDHATGTVYVANFGGGSSGTLTVINAATCNASVTKGCTSAETIPVAAGNPDDIVVNAATDTVYVGVMTSSGPNVIAVFDGATCNAEHTTGCGQAPSLLRVADSGGGDSTITVAINPLTNTVYATNVIYSSQDAHSVYVINGATCDAETASDCSQVPATIRVGEDPRGLVVDSRTDTVYVVNHVQGDDLGSVSVINGATCDGVNVSGCGQRPRTIAGGQGAINVALDPAIDSIYVTNLQDTSVSVFKISQCTGRDGRGCGHVPAELAVGNYPFGIAVDSAIGSAYVTNGDNTVSVVPLRP